MTAKLSKHDRAAMRLHDLLVELAKTAREEHETTRRRERLAVQAREADLVFRAERAFRAFQRVA